MDSSPARYIPSAAYRRNFRATSSFGSVGNGFSENDMVICIILLLTSNLTPHSQAQNQPVFQRALQFFTAGIQQLGVCPYSLKTGNLTVICPILEDSIFSQAHCLMNV